MTTRPWAISLLEAIGRLLVVIAGREAACPDAEECAVELADDINDYAYRLEHDIQQPNESN